MCFMAGANSIFYGDKLLTTDNPEANDDRALLAKLGLKTRATTLDSVQKRSLRLLRHGGSIIRPTPRVIDRPRTTRHGYS